MTLPDLPGQPRTDPNAVVAPSTPAGVFDAVESALHKTFGLDGQVTVADNDDTSRTFGFLSAGTPYNLRVNVTP